MTAETLIRHPVAFLHTAYPAIQPLVQYYSAHAPDLEITNLLEDALIRMLAAQEFQRVERRLRAMLEVARDEYASRAAMVTCSSVPLEMARRLEDQIGIPVVKVDGPMARKAVASAGTIGVAVTFEGTIGPTTRLLNTAAAELGRDVEIFIETSPAAYRALLSGDLAAHDAELLECVRRIEARGAGCIVLAQVSMGRVHAAARAAVNVPVLSSFDTSLEGLRQSLGVSAQTA